MKQGSIELEYSYPSELESEELMFADLEVALSRCAVGQDMRNKIKLCVSEAFSNALVHGNRLVPNKKVTLRIRTNCERFVADISDEGEGGLRKAMSRKPARELDEGGRGIDLMQGAASDVMITSRENGGLLVSLTFELKQEQIESIDISTATDDEHSESVNR